VLGRILCGLCVPIFYPGRGTRIARWLDYDRPVATREGWRGWDEYAPFYDWENAQTLGRRDVRFWTRVASQARGRVLALGCRTGRVSLPLARAGVNLVGIDRSAGMLDRATHQRTRLPPARLRLVRGDIRSLPFRDGEFAMAIAPYGILQS